MDRRLGAPLRRTSTILAAVLAGACGSGTDGGATAPATDAGRPRSVVVFTVDTLRADQLGCYGNTAYPTPNADRLAAESVVFARAYTQATLTHPALSSMLSGLHPFRHQVMGQSASLGPAVVPLATAVRAQGIATGSFVANLCKLQEVERTVFHDGWDEAWCGMSPPEAEDDQYLWDQRVVGAAIEWIEQQDGPFLCWVHLMDPHAEHRPDPALWDYAARPVEEKYAQYRSYNAYEENRTFPPEDVAAELWDLYAAEVQGMDRELGRMLDYLDDRGDGGEIALIFSADHGEELYETWSRYDHGLSMSEGVLWVPLMVRTPGEAPRTVDHVVELLQVTPTVLSLLDVPLPYRLDGPSLLAPAQRDFAASFTEKISISLRTRDERYWFRRTPEPWTRPPDEAPWRADAPWFREKELLAVYDGPRRTAVRWLDADEPEVRSRMGALNAALQDFMMVIGPPPKPAQIEDPELRAELLRLGYTDGD